MTEPEQEAELRPRRRVGRFELFTEIASGGMATVHLGRVVGHSDFARVVAVKRLHPQYAKDPVFTRMFLDEARVVARIRHPNVLPTIDLIEGQGELFIVMEYIEGETFAALMREARRRKERVPVGVALRIICGALHGLHAAHEVTNERGEPMNLVHRDVSPDNIIVGADGFARLLDFGIARALGMYSQTREGEVKGKLAYMTPEQIMGETITARTDVFAASVVLWQALTGRQLFKGKHVGEYTHKILNKAIDPPSYVLPDLPKKLDPLVLHGLEREVAKRWFSAQAMAEAIEEVGDLATQREVGVWVRRLGAEHLAVMARKVAAVENAPRNAPPRSLPPPSSDDMMDEPSGGVDPVEIVAVSPAAAANPGAPRPGAPRPQSVRPAPPKSASIGPKPPPPPKHAQPTSKDDKPAAATTKPNDDKPAADDVAPPAPAPEPPSDDEQAAEPAAAAAPSPPKPAVARRGLAPMAPEQRRVLFVGGVVVLMGIVGLAAWGLGTGGAGEASAGSSTPTAGSSAEVSSSVTAAAADAAGPIESATASGPASASTETATAPPAAPPGTASESAPTVKPAGTGKTAPSSTGHPKGKGKKGLYGRK